MSKYNLNHVVEQGNLTRDAELKYTQDGTPIAKFGIAVNKKDYVNYFNVVMFGKIAESLQEYLKKGTQVIVDGELRQERWEDKDGNKREAILINANEIFLIGGKNAN